MAASKYLGKEIMRKKWLKKVIDFVAVRYKTRGPPRAIIFNSDLKQEEQLEVLERIADEQNNYVEGLL